MANVVGNLDIDSYNQLTLTWVLGNADNGNAGLCLRWADKWVQALGTFGGATITIQVSNDGATWVGATTDGTTALTFVGAGYKRVWENSKFVRAISSGGAGTSVTVILVGSA